MRRTNKKSVRASLIKLRGLCHQHNINVDDMPMPRDVRTCSDLGDQIGLVMERLQKAGVMDGNVVVK